VGFKKLRLAINGFSAKNTFALVTVVFLGTWFKPVPHLTSRPATGVFRFGES
jgi:hypothetical protein